MLIFMLVLHIFICQGFLLVCFVGFFSLVPFVCLFVSQLQDVREDCLCGLLFVLYWSNYFRIATLHTNSSGVCKSFQKDTDCLTKWIVQGHTICATAILVLYTTPGCEWNSSVSVFFSAHSSLTWGPSTPSSWQSSCTFPK